MINAANQHPEDIRASVRKKGLTLTELALRSGLHTSALSHSLRRCIPAANRAIARHLDQSLHALWPEWFDAEGNRRSRTLRASRQLAGKASPKGTPAIGT